MNKVSTVSHIFTYLYIFLFIPIPLYFLQTTDAKQTNCTISAKTVKPVDRCPTTEEDWRKAAVVKNCSAYASLCNDSKTYVYHCLVNAYVNQTVEVCAIQINIVGGKDILCQLRDSNNIAPVIIGQQK